MSGEDDLRVLYHRGEYDMTMDFHEFANMCRERSKPTVIKGVSPDEPTIINAQGGKQSKTEYAFDLIYPDAILALAEVLKKGADKYGKDNWKNITAAENFNHMIVHYYAWLKGDRSDDHLAHMFTRAMMLYASAKQQEREK